MVKSKTIDVEAIVIQVMTKVFELNDAEVGNLKEQIAYLQSSGAVQRVSNLKLLYNAIKKRLQNSKEYVQKLCVQCYSKPLNPVYDL